PGRDGLLLRDAVLLHRPVLEAGLDRWLDRHGVRRLRDGDALAMRADGSAELVAGDEHVEIGQTVLADDAAILAHVPAALWPPLLARRVTSTNATEPTRPPAGPLPHRLDTDLTMLQQAERGIAAIGPGAIDPFAAALGVLLGREREFRQAGQSSYESVITADGAPAVGRLRGQGPDVLAGLGPAAAFLAPAI